MNMESQQHICNRPLHSNFFNLCNRPLHSNFFKLDKSAPLNFLVDLCLDCAWTVLASIGVWNITFSRSP